MYENEAQVIKTIAAEWFLSYVIKANGDTEIFEGSVANDFSKLNTSMAGYEYVLIGRIVNRKGETVKYANQEELKFTIRINENVDLKEMFEGINEKEVRFTYKENGHYDPTLPGGVNVTGIKYMQGNDVVGQVEYVYDDLTGQVQINDLVTKDGVSYPVDSGSYTAVVTLSGYGKVDEVTVNYVIDPIDISAEGSDAITVIDLMQIYDSGKETYEVRCGIAGDDDNLSVTLKVTYATENGTLNAEGLPVGIGDYTVTIKVDGKNYTGTTEVTLHVVKQITVRFYEFDAETQADKETRSITTGNGMYLTGITDEKVWYTDAERTEKFLFSKPVTVTGNASEIKLYAEIPISS